MSNKVENMQILTREEHLNTLYKNSIGIEMARAGQIVTFETRGDSFEVVDKEKRYKQIIEILKESKFPLSAKEIAVAMHRKGFTPTSERNFAAPRLTELSNKGVVEPCGKTKCFYTGKSVSVYHLIECHD